MAGPGTPESYAIRLGDLVGRIRSQRGFSRAKLVIAMCDCLPQDSPLRKRVSEGLIRQIEEGKKVKTSRELLEVLCQALRCTPPERLQIFMAGDFEGAKAKLKNADQALVFALALYREDPLVQQFLQTLVGDQQASRMTENDLKRMLRKVVLSLSERTSVEQSHTESITLNKQH